VLVHPINKELAGDADAVAFPVLQVLVLHVAPSLHHWHTRSTNVPVIQRGNNKALLDTPVA